MRHANGGWYLIWNEMTGLSWTLAYVYTTLLAWNCPVYGITERLFIRIGSVIISSRQDFLSSRLQY